MSKQAREIAGAVVPPVESARDKLVDDYLPQAQHLVAEAASTVRDAVHDAKAHAQEALPTHEAPARKSHRLRKLLMMLGLTGLGAMVVKKLRGQKARPTTYTRPQPVPPQAPRPEATPLADSAAEAVASTADTGGGTPGEQLADAGEGPHPVTTPEKPVEEVDVSAEAEPKASD